MPNSAMIENFWDIMQVDANKNFFSYYLFTWVISNVKDAFGYCCRNRLTLNEYCPDNRFGNHKNEKTTYISVRLSELWENGIYETVKMLFGNLEYSTSSVQRWTTEEGDIKIFNEVWEIKTSQAKDSWTGATHSSRKSPRYILVNYSVDLEYRLDVNNNFNLIKGMSIFLLDASSIIDSNLFIGEATNRSSFTTLKLKNEWLESGIITKIYGDLIPCKKNLKVIHASPFNLLSLF